MDGAGFVGRLIAQVEGAAVVAPLFRLELTLRCSHLQFDAKSRHGIAAFAHCMGQRLVLVLVVIVQVAAVPAMQIGRVDRAGVFRRVQHRHGVVGHIVMDKIVNGLVARAFMNELAARQRTGPRNGAVRCPSRLRTLTNSRSSPGGLT